MTRRGGFRGAVLAGLLALTLSACGGVSEADLQGARQAGAQEQAQKEEASRQAEAQSNLAADVERLKEEAEAAKTAQAEAEAKAREDARAAADAAAKAKASADAKAKAATQPKKTQCSDRVSAGGSTSCAFALIVENSFYTAGGGNPVLDVYSPVTGRWYTMRCQAGIPSVCRGGDNNNAVVYIR